MLTAAVTAFSMMGGFSLLLVLLRYNKSLATSWKPAAFLLAVESGLFFALCVSRAAHWLILPAGWLLCLIPLWIYCFFFSPPHLMGQRFLFVASAFIYLFPPFMLSLIAGIIFRLFFY